MFILTFILEGRVNDSHLAVILFHKQGRTTEVKIRCHKKPLCSRVYSNELRKLVSQALLEVKGC